MKRRFFYCMLLLWSGITSAADNRSDTTERANRISPTVLAVAEVMPSVVNLSTEKILDDSDPDQWYEFAPETVMMGRQRSYSLGSGSVIDASGLILTNAHVVDRAVRIRVTFNDVERYLAEVVAIDKLNDLALLRLVGDGGNHWKPIEMGQPGDLLLGENVIIVGNPYGLGSSIACGVLSAIGRKLTYRNKIVFSDVLQTDATIHPGNSGGPLININGEMIGINTSILKGTQGISFAIPLQRVQNVLGKWLIPERFRDVSLGIVPGVRRLPDGSLSFYLQEVLPDSPAARAGLKTDMILKSVNGQPVDNLINLSRMLWKVQPDTVISLETDTGKYQLRAVELEAGDWQKAAELKLGIGLQILNADLAQALNYPFRGGLLISNLSPGVGTNAERGDLLLQLGDISINTPEDLIRVLRNYRYGQEVPAVLLQVSQQDGRYFLSKKNTVFKVN